MLTSIRVMVESSAAASAGRHGGDLDLVVETSMLTTAWDASQKLQTGALRFHQELNCPAKALLALAWTRFWCGLYRAMSVYAFALSVRSADEFEAGWR